MGHATRGSILGLLITLLLCVPARQAQAADAALAWNAASSSVAAGASVDVDITVAAAANLGGYDLSLTFPPSLLRLDALTDAGFVTSGDNIVICNAAVIDNTGGSASLTCATVAIFGPPGPGVSTSAPATLAHAKFTGLASGNAVISLAGSTLSDPEDLPLAATTSPGAIAVLATCSTGSDGDADGINDCADNCRSVANTSQANTDAIVKINPPKLFDDITAVNSDTRGDACDLDDDNDGRADIDEGNAALCNGRLSSAIAADTDGDRFLDGAECALDANPARGAPNSTAEPDNRPSLSACGDTTDADADGISLRTEVCFYNSSPVSPNTDGDACSDGKEIASVNGDLSVNVVDLQQVAQTLVGVYAIPASPEKYNFDVNKDGSLNVIDLQQIAQRMGVC